MGARARLLWLLLRGVALAAAIDVTVGCWLLVALPAREQRGARGPSRSASFCEPFECARTSGMHAALTCSEEGRRNDCGRLTSHFFRLVGEGEGEDDEGDEGAGRGQRKGNIRRGAQWGALRDALTGEGRGRCRRAISGPGSERPS